MILGDLIRLDLIQPNLTQGDLIRPDLIRFDPIKFDPIQLDPAQLLRLTLTQRGNPASGKPDKMTYAEQRDLVNVYNNSRAFCGNPRRAVRDWEEENRPLTDEEYFDLIGLANLAWDEAGRTWEGAR